MQHEHYTHTAPDIPSSTALSIFFFLLHFLLMQLLFFLFVLFQNFLHDFLCHKPILHFRFDFLLEIPRTPCPDQRAIPQNIVHHLSSQGCSIFLPFSHTLVWNRIISDSSSASWIPFLASSVLTRPINAWITFVSIGFSGIFIR